MVECSSDSRALQVGNCSTIICTNDVFQFTPLLSSWSTRRNMRAWKKNFIVLLTACISFIDCFHLSRFFFCWWLPLYAIYPFSYTFRQVKRGEREDQRERAEARSRGDMTPQTIKNKKLKQIITRNPSQLEAHKYVHFTVSLNYADNAVCDLSDMYWWFILSGRYLRVCTKSSSTKASVCSQKKRFFSLHIINVVSL